jgi:hypothetical protein
MRCNHPVRAVYSGIISDLGLNVLELAHDSALAGCRAYENAYIHRYISLLVFN